MGMRPRLLLTLGPEHVGKRSIGAAKCPRCGHLEQPIPIGDAIGRVQPGDVGKRVYDVDGVIQVENNEQRDAHLRAMS